MFLATRLATRVVADAKVDPTMAAGRSVVAHVVLVHCFFGSRCSGGGDDGGLGRFIVAI